MTIAFAISIVYIKKEVQESKGWQTFDTIIKPFKSQFGLPVFQVPGLSSGYSASD